MKKTLFQVSGMLAVVWVGGLYAFLRFHLVYKLPNSEQLNNLIPVAICGWLGAGLLIALAGLWRGNVVARICALGAIGMSLCLLTQYPGIDLMVANLFRKDEYAYIYHGAPVCRIEIPIQKEEEIATFDETVKTFARRQGIRECRQKLYLAYDGGPRPQYKGEHVAIWSGVGWTTNASLKTGSILLAPYDEAYPAKDFQNLADSLVAAMRSAFPDRLKVTLSEYGEKMRPAAPEPASAASAISN